MPYPTEGDSVEIKLRSTGNGKIVKSKHPVIEYVAAVYGPRRVKTTSGDVWNVALGSSTKWMAVG